MKVLILFSSSGIGGAERSLTRMVSNNKNLDLTYELATFSQDGDWLQWSNSLDLKSTCFDNSFFKTVKYIQKNNPDCIYIIGFRLSVYLRFLKFLFPKTKLIQGVRWNPESNVSLDKFFRFVERYFSFLLTSYISNSEAAKRTMVNFGINKNKISVIHNGINSHSNQGKKTHHNRIISVANLNPRKGYIEFLSVVEKVVEQFPDVEFLFIGRDDMDETINKKMRERGLDKNVKCMGFQSDISQYMQQSQIFVLPSLYGEGCPTTILEAFMYKMCVVAYKIDGIPELVDDQKNGLLFELGHESQMADGIIDLLRHPLKAEEMGNVGHEKISSHFLMDDMLSKHNNFFLGVK